MHRKIITLTSLLSMGLLCLSSAWGKQTPPIQEPKEAPIKSAIREMKDKIKQKTGLELVHIPQSTFKMGFFLADFVNTIREVSVDGFYMGLNVVTVAQYRRFCEATGKMMPPEPHAGGNSFNPNWSKGDHPIVNVDWAGAKAYCDWVSKEVGVACDLPTEAEWECAARGGLKEKVFPWGDVFDKTKLHRSKERRGDAGGTAPVGTHPANGYGLYDMAGNVWEWCNDWYAEKYNPNDTDNPKGPPKGQYHVLRGGSWEYVFPGAFRCAARSTLNLPDQSLDAVGFRVVFRKLQ